MASAPGLGGWRIDQIHVKGFKSFSGPQWALFDVPAQARLVGITGPNGSGKSTLLEAICFATGCGTTTLRGCKSLRDVTSTGSTQLPEVKIRFACSSSSSRALGRKPVGRHLLEASLTPQGTRAYKVDGRIKNGSQVKDFLRGLGIVVNPTTIIQQATVTQLADINNAATLAELVASASGLAIWQQESAAAHQEIVRSRRSLRDIQANISTVQQAAAADEAAVQAALQAAQLQDGLEAVLARLLAGMQGQQQQQQALLQQAEHDQAASQDAMTSSVQHASTISAQLQQLATQRAAAVKKLDACDSSDGPGRTTCQPLTTQIAAAEAAAQTASNAAAAHAALKAELLAKQELLQQTEKQVQQLQQAAQHKRRAASQAAASLASVEAATSAAASLQQQQLETQKQLAATAAGLVEQQGAVSSSSRNLQQARSQLACVQQSLQQQQQQGGATSPADAAAAVSGAAQAAATASQTIGKLRQQLLQCQMDADAAAAALDSGVPGVLLACDRSAAAGGAAGCSAVALHKCFSIKAAASDGAAASNLLTALAGIAGPAVLQVLVVPTAQQANQLLATVARSSSSSASSGSGSRAKLKIWPLDRLQARNQLPAQRAAQQALGAGKVLLPLDLLHYEPAHAAALARAFGSYVIAADDATAAALVERHNLSCITLDGTVSRKGSMSGGWAGSSGSYARALWQHKLQHDAATHRAARLRRELSAAEDTRAQLQAELLAAEQCAAAAKQAHLLQQEEQKQQAAVAAAASLLQQDKQRLQEVRDVHSSLQERLGCCQAAMQSCDKRAPAAADAQAAALKRQLQQDAQRAAVVADSAVRELEEAQEKAVELAAAIDTMQLQLASAPDSQKHQQTLLQQEQLLQRLLQQQSEQEAASAALKSRIREVAEQQRRLESQLQQAHKQHAITQQHLRDAAGRCSSAAAALKQAKKELRQVVQDFAATDAVRTFEAAASGSSGDAGAGAPRPVGADSRLEVGRLGRKARELQAQLAQLEVEDLPLAQRELLEARVAQVQQFRAEMSSLSDSADALEQHIQLQSEQVYVANDAVFEEVAVGFGELCSSLLPTLELRLARTGGLAHEGLQFRFRCNRSAAAGDDAEEADEFDDLQLSSHTDNGSAVRQHGRQHQWQTSLSMLSGGQRTLVSLAMLLAVARAGNSTGLFLLDEVDAALDEHNTARAAALLKQLAHADDGGRGCQILCVTHNVAFQHVCDGFVQVDAAGSRTGGADASAAGAGPAEGTSHKSAAKKVRFAG